MSTPKKRRGPAEPGPTRTDPGTLDALHPTLAETASNPGQRSSPSVPLTGVPTALRTWERYQIIEILGAGGMGAVYKGRDPRLNRLVALKLIHPRLGHGPGSSGEVVIRRFQREARLQAALDHPHICKVYEIGELPSHGDDPGHPYIAMQLIEGQPLHVAVSEMSLYEKVQVMKQVAEALHTAHRQGLIHRDIKPSNRTLEAARRAILPKRDVTRLSPSIRSRPWRWNDCTRFTFCAPRPA